MIFGWEKLYYSFVSGALTVLSPCIIPVLPLLVGSAFQRFRYGPFAILSGMVVAFTWASVNLLDLAGQHGLDPAGVRRGVALLTMAFGIYLASAVPNWIYDKLYAPIPGMFRRLVLCTVLPELVGLFFVGLLLGIVWNPCSGPTLGAAYMLASNPASKIQAIPLLVLFALGAGFPLLFISYLFKAVFQLVFGEPESMQIRENKLFATIVTCVGALVISGVDKIAETELLGVLPNWIVDLSTRY